MGRDGQHLVVSGALYRSTPPGVWVVNADGTSTNPTNLWNAADGPVQVLAVSSRDTIAVASGADSILDATLTFMELDGAQRRAVDPTVRGWSGAWSPDGAWFGGIAKAPETDQYQIFVVKADGTGVTRLTQATGGGPPLFGGWSPGSDRLM